MGWVLGQNSDGGRAVLLALLGRDLGQFSPTVLRGSCPRIPDSESTIKRYFTTAKAIARTTRRFGSTINATPSPAPSHPRASSFMLRDLLGHTSTRTTERYARPSAEALEAVIRALG